MGAGLFLCPEVCASAGRKEQADAYTVQQVNKTAVVAWNRKEFTSFRFQEVTNENQI